MKRYICDNVYEEESPDGEWVRYEDHVAELALLMRPLVEPKQPSDPKHLPPRDCLVLYEWPRSTLGAYWVHAQFRDNGEPTWSELCTADPIDPSRVITWRELPEVE